MPTGLINQNPSSDWKSGQIAYFEKPDEPDKIDWGEVHSVQKPPTMNPDDIHLYRVNVLYQRLLYDFTPDRLFKSYAQAEQALKDRSAAKSNAYAAEIRTAEDLIRFMYAHGFSISNGTCQAEAIRNAIKSCAESLCDIRLQDV